MKRIIYFGCVRDKGHYLWCNEGCHIANRSSLERFTGITGVTDNFLRSIDGTYTPFVSTQGSYKVSVVPPFTIVAWHDYTVDSRPGSNSVLLAFGYESADDAVKKIIEDAAKTFPSVMSRQHPLVRVNL